MAMGDISHGEKILKNVKHVIAIKQGGKNNIGPALIQRNWKKSWNCKRL